MNAGRELDVLIAEKIMGLKVVHRTWAGGKCSSYTIGDPEYSFTGDEPGGILTNRLPNYSEDISAAWEVVQKMFDDAWMMELSASKCVDDEISEVKFTCTCQARGRYSVEAKSTPEAICLAALKAVE